MESVINVDVKGIDELMGHVDRLKALLIELKELTDKINGATLTFDVKTP